MRASDLINLCVPSGGPLSDVCPAELRVPNIGIFSVPMRTDIRLSRDLSEVSFPLVTKLALDSLPRLAPTTEQPHSVVIYTDDSAFSSF